MLSAKLLTVIAGLAIIGLIFTYIASEVDRTKRNVGTIVALLVAILCGFALFPVQEKLKGGIDLVGGVKYTVEIQPGEDEDGNPIPVNPDAVEQVKQTLQERIDPTGTLNLFIQGLGTDRLVIEMPGVDAEVAAEVEDKIKRTVRLELKQVHPNSRSLIAQIEAKEAQIPAGYRSYDMDIKDKKGKPTGEVEKILLRQRNIVGGEHVKRANPSGEFGKLLVKLNSDGGDKLLKATSNMKIGTDRMAVVMDGKCLIAPTVQDRLKSSFEISGLDSRAEVRTIAAALNNPLKNSLEILSNSEIGAKLGASIVKQGITAGIIGLALTFVFVLLYYRFAGIIALIGLVLNMLIVFGAMAMLGATFTLPGIAGIVLTIGIAVDANVLIYERLREERANGKSIQSAIRAAYEKAFSAIFDANITSLITAIVLFWLASSTVKGFAVTLTIGILGSMFSALLVTRVLFFWFEKSKAVSKINFMDLVPKQTIDFLGKRKICFILSTIALIASIGMTGIKKDDSLGIDFTGGSVVSVQLDPGEEITADELTASLDDITGSLDKTPQIQQESVPNSGPLLTVRCGEKDVEQIKAELIKDFKLVADNPNKISDETMSAALGGEFFRNSILALAVGLIAILLYISIRFEFSFAVGAFAALVHDIIISIGVIVIMGHELAMIHVGALLAIAGYSINDTIVVFDRIRETLRSKRGDVRDIMNLAINATLSRTILTSATTIGAVLVLWIFGGSGLREFSFAILIGLIVGTYSSIFIASPIVYVWSKMRGSNLRRELLDANLEAQVNPVKG